MLEEYAQAKEDSCKDLDRFGLKKKSNLQLEDEYQESCRADGAARWNLELWMHVNAELGIDAAGA
jgi:hypothetical protein